MHNLLRVDRLRYAPILLPTALKYAEWDFELQSTTPISSFTEPVTGAAFVQAVGADQPTLNPTAYNMRKCGVFDGTDNLRNSTAVATLGWPTGGAFEVWCDFEWTGGQLGSGVGFLFNYPVNAVNTSMLLGASAANGLVMRTQFRVGSGAASVALTDSAVNIVSGRHIARGISDGANIRLDVDGNVGPWTACVAGGFTGGPRHTIGANSAVTPASFFIGNINYLVLTRPLNEFYANNLYRNLTIRRGWGR